MNKETREQREERQARQDQFHQDSVVVLVDDMRSFRPEIAGTENVVVLRTLSEAIAWLDRFVIDMQAGVNTPKISQIWLDHDLGTDLDGEPSNIMPFVHRIEELAVEDELPDIGMFVVHTSNPVGRRAIASALSKTDISVAQVEASYYLYVKSPDSQQ